MASMIARLVVDAEVLRGEATLERLVAETRCASCAEVERRHRFLDGAADEPEGFCPNAGMIGEIAGERRDLPEEQDANRRFVPLNVSRPHRR